MANPQQHVVFQPPTMFNAAALINDILDMDIAVAEFNSVPAKEAPWRDIPSVLIAHLNRPETTKQEPGWELLLAYFAKPIATHGRANLQDLYMFITRIVLPNIIQSNRKRMLSMYMARKNLSAVCRLRYDSIVTTPTSNIPVPTREATANAIPNRSIFRSTLTPNGIRFLQWLRTPLPTPPPHHPVPHQMTHRVSDIDTYLTDDEMSVRAMQTNELILRTAKVLSIWWKIACNTVILMDYEQKGWVGVEEKF